MNMAPRSPSGLTISVVSHGHGVLLLNLLQDLCATPSAKGAHVIVTFNVPEPALNAADYPELNLEFIKNDRPMGFGANHNQAHSRCRTTWFAILNPDLRLQDQDPFPTLLSALQSDPRLGLVAPRVVNAVGAREDSVRANLTWPSLWRRVVGGQRAPLEVETEAGRGRSFYWIAGMFFLVRSDVFGAIGGFDERYFLYCEDYDLCARLVLHERPPKFVPEAQVVHLAQRDSHRRWRHLRWHLTSLFKVWTSAAFWRVTHGRS
jgi:GT2 family glycosyltransferase